MRATVGCFCIAAMAATDLASGFVPNVRVNVVPSLPCSAMTSSREALRLHLVAASQRQSSSGYSTSRHRNGVQGEAPFEIRGFSLANAASLVGVGITVASFAEYFTSGGAGGLSGIGFVYGIPISLIGLALKYAELAPAPVQTTPEAEALFQEKATETIKKIVSDVTRHRYGDEAHLDTTIKTLGLVMPQSDYPQLEYLTQTVEPNGELGFMMVFQSRATPFKKWVEPERVQKYVTFFGPGVDAEVVKVSSKDRLVGIKLTTLPPGVSPTPKIMEEPTSDTPSETPDTSPTDKPLIESET